MKKITVKRAAIEIFGGCNYKCTMCPQSTGRGPSWTRKMPLSHFTHLLDQLDGLPLIQLEGSGEAFLAKDLDLYVRECTKRGFSSFIKTNGSFDLTLLDKVLDAGLNFIRFSIVGYDQKTYLENMKVDNFDKLLGNIDYCNKIIDQKKYNCKVSMYNLIIDTHNIVNEIEYYKSISAKLNTVTSVWKMHNWSGNIDKHDRKINYKKRSCGRPFASQITIRAGGEFGRIGAVTPCTQTLGPPNEVLSVLGYSDSDTLHDIYYGEKYQTLRNLHKQEKFDDIEYCKNCDFLYDDNEVLVWTNDPTQNLGTFQGTDVNLFLDKK